MAQIESGSSGRRVSVELNLVPFIDLMSVLITFLLITAVWTQVSMIQIGSSLYAKKLDDQPPPIPPPNADVVLKIDVKESGYILTVGVQQISLPKIMATATNSPAGTLPGTYLYDDASLLAQLQRVKQIYPAKVDAVVSVSDTLAYEYLIKTMDKILISGFSSISVATGGPN